MVARWSGFLPPRAPSSIEDGEVFSPQRRRGNTEGTEDIFLPPRAPRSPRTPREMVLAGGRGDAGRGDGICGRATQWVAPTAWDVRLGRDWQAGVSGSVGVRGLVVVLDGGHDAFDAAGDMGGNARVEGTACPADHIIKAAAIDRFHYGRVVEGALLHKADVFER